MGPPGFWPQRPRRASVRLKICRDFASDAAPASRPVSAGLVDTFVDTPSQLGSEAGSSESRCTYVLSVKPGSEWPRRTPLRQRSGTSPEPTLSTIPLVSTRHARRDPVLRPGGLAWNCGRPGGRVRRSFLPRADEVGLGGAATFVAPASGRHRTRELTGGEVARLGQRSRMTPEGLSRRESSTP
jgi:hypothetical protein